MAVRPPQNLASGSLFQTGASILDVEIQEEKALSLGRAGRAVEAALARLEDPEALAQEGRETLLTAAAQAVWKFFIQREACGARDHRPIIAHYAIPRAVLARLGAM
jgi:hypothetical protein